MRTRFCLGLICAFWPAIAAHASSDRDQSQDEHVFQGKVTLSPEQSAHINPRYEGIVTKVYVREGDQIKSGSRLATIERNVGMSVYHITSPVTGTVLHRDLAPGEFVTSEREAFALANLDSLWVKFDVHPGEIKHFKSRKEITIRSRISKITAIGELFYISPTVVEQTRTIPVYARLDNKERSWLPYQLVDGSLTGHTHQGGGHD